MDEPFGALDTQTRSTMQRLLVDVWRQTDATVVFVTHDVDEALALADRIVVLSLNGPAVGEVVEVPDPRASTADDPGRRRLREHVLDALNRAVGRATGAPSGPADNRIGGPAGSRVAGPAAPTD
jgi:NitT/TauT family transport system ATP-binding protein